MQEQMTLSFEDRWQAVFEKWKATADGQRFLDAVYRRVHVAMLEGRKIGVKRVIEDVRWDTKIAFNNGCGSVLARWLVAKDPQFGKVIELRQRHAGPAGPKAALRMLHGELETIGQRILAGSPAPTPVGWGRQAGS